MQELLTQVADVNDLHRGVIVTDLAGTVVRWNAAAERMCGWSAEEAVGSRLVELLDVEAGPDELLGRPPAEAHPCDRAVRRRDGTAFLARVHHHPLREGPGALSALMVLVEDVTDRRWSEQRARDHGERAQRALAAARVGAWHGDVASGLATWDETMESLLGLEPGTFGGSRQDWLGRIHDEERDQVLGGLRQAVSDGAPVDLEHRAVRTDGAVRWLRTIGRPLTRADGTTSGITGISFDVTERHRAEEERAAFLASERARRDRVAFLAEASATFAEFLDDSEILTTVGKLVVPRLADWFALDAVVDGRIRTVAVGHTDPAKLDLLEGLRRGRAKGAGAVADVQGVLETGRGRLHATADEADVALPGDDAHRQLLHKVGVRSVITTPLTARGRTFGALTLVLAEEDLRYTADDLLLAGDLAGRAALAIDNARLYADRAEVARVLQQSLLPPQMPEVPGIDLAARYRSAQVGSDIGGDFYDVFLTPSDHWAIVIGDVSGKGTSAAVLTGHARHTVRAAAMREPDPARVLTELNQAILAQDHDERFLTVAYARMQVTSGGAELVVASAGHPAPLVLRADGSLDVLDCHGGVIGLFADTDVFEVPVRLGAGDALILHTDGVLEARGREGFFDEERLHALLRSCAGLSAATITERIDETVLAFQDGRPRDDVAVLVVRVAPPLDPIDPTAGPEHLETRR